MKYFSVSVNTPVKDCYRVRQAIGKAGAGTIGAYKHCSFSYKGIGRSIPITGADPAIGKIGKLEEIPEERIETFCTEEKLQDVIKAIKYAHPYEEPAITVYPIEIY